MAESAKMYGQRPRRQRLAGNSISDARRTEAFLLASQPWSNSGGGTFNFPIDSLIGRFVPTLILKAHSRRVSLGCSPLRPLKAMDWFQLRSALMALVFFLLRRFLFELF